MIDDRGTKHQVKCRRRFDNPMRKSYNPGLIGGLQKKGYDIAIIVEIGKDYELIDIFSISSEILFALELKKSFSLAQLKGLADEHI